MPYILNPSTQPGQSNQFLMAWLENQGEPEWIEDASLLGEEDAKMLWNAINHRTEQGRTNNLALEVIEDIFNLVEDKQGYTPRFRYYRNDPKGGE